MIIFGFHVSESVRLLKHFMLLIHVCFVKKRNYPVSRTNTRHKNRCFMLCKITHIIDMHKQCSVTRSDLSASWGQLLNTVCSLEAFRERFAVKARNNRRILLQNARNQWGTIFVDEGPHHSSRPIDDHRHRHRHHHRQRHRHRHRHRSKTGPPFDPLSRLRSKFPRGRSTPTPIFVCVFPTKNCRR